MAQLRTHYDNLQVSRNATSEVILAAYRALSLKYDPDRNRGDARCAEVMRIVDKSFTVLMDASQRSAHDEWIAKKEAQATQGSDRRESDNPGDQGTGQSASNNKPKRPIPWRRWLQIAPIVLYQFRAVIFIGAIVALVIFVSLLPAQKPQPSGLPRYDPTPAESSASFGAGDPVASPSAATPRYARPETAPNGAPWPTEAGYIEGEDSSRSGGLSTVRIDNKLNTRDVFVKLVAIEPSKTYPVRQFFIPAGGEFTVTSITAGRYDIRYQDLSNGALLRTESFNLEQIDETDGTRASAITMTLYPVPNGHMVTYPLQPSEF